VLVTHDPEEAALLADELIVIDRGKALQQGTVQDIFAHPASPQVAALVGISNTYPGAVLGPERIHTEGVEVCAPTAHLPPGTEVTWAIRPEDITVGNGHGYRAKLLDVVQLAGGPELALELDGLHLTARPRGVVSAAPGGELRVELPPEAIKVWKAV
jgi:molybdate transport system permease protein